MSTPSKMISKLASLILALTVVIAGIAGSSQPADAKLRHKLLVAGALLGAGALVGAGVAHAARPRYVAPSVTYVAPVRYVAPVAPVRYVTPVRYVAPASYVTAPPAAAPPAPYCKAPAMLCMIDSSGREFCREDRICP